MGEKATVHFRPEGAHVGDLWDPRRFITQECPDVFRMGEHWYLVYSEFSDAFQTRYRIASSPDGPWLAPGDDAVEGRAFQEQRVARPRATRRRPASEYLKMFIVKCASSS